MCPGHSLFTPQYHLHFSKFFALCKQSKNLVQVFDMKACNIVWCLGAAGVWRLYIYTYIFIYKYTIHTHTHTCILHIQYISFLTIATTAAPAPARAQTNRWKVMSSCGKEKKKENGSKQPLLLTASCHCVDAFKQKDLYWACRVLLYLLSAAQTHLINQLNVFSLQYLLPFN